MSTQIPADVVEEVVGAQRHDYLHIANLDLETLCLNLLHPHSCKATYDDLRECPYSEAMDELWIGDEKEFEPETPTFVVLEDGRLQPWSPTWISPV